MAKAGWFANPDGSPSLRYYDGQGWTAHTMALGPPRPPTPPPRPVPPVVAAPQPTPPPAAPNPVNRRPQFQSGPVVAALVAGLVMGALIGLTLAGHGESKNSPSVGTYPTSSAVSRPVSPTTVPTTSAGSRPTPSTSPRPTLAFTP
jgi:hypothetical protein